ncbi:MAG: cytochrome c-type biogenesis protein CcmH [Phenylobacterium sp.]|jgi:cytochrome c-type biogenesis protein CcmH
MNKFSAMVLSFCLSLSLSLLTPLAVAAEDSKSGEIHDFASPAQKSLYLELTDELRCPKCQNQNIADSNAGIAKDLRAKVYKLVSEGQDKEQVIDFMVERYGYFVYYKPPVTPGTIILWLLPILFALFTMTLIWIKSKRSQMAIEKPHWDEEQEQELADLMTQIAKPSQPPQAAKGEH